MGTMAPTKSDQEWLASLAHKSASSDVATSTKCSKKKKAHKRNADKSIIASAGQLPSKAERIQHRQEKRRKREERKQKIEEERQTRLAKKRGGQKPHRDNVPSNSESGASRSKHQTSQPTEKPLRRGMTPSSKKALTTLSSTLASTISLHKEQSNHNKKRHPKNKSTEHLINGLPPLPKGKATKSSTLTPHSTELQPRIRDYNGQGLARPSLFLPLNDPSFIPRLEEEFAEHIPGFFGIAKKKAGKRQKAEEEGMLWRRCLEEKMKGDGGGGKRKKKVVNMI
jgi:hypothetical protein